MNLDLTSASWFLARGSGISALVLFSVVMVLGVLTRSGRAVLGIPRFALRSVHSSAALLALAFLGLHIATLLFDPYAQVRLIDLVVPFAGAYRPLWVGLGTLALDLLLALAVTTAVRHRIGPRLWRAIHLGAYVAWPVAVLHGLGTGTDAGTPWMTAVTVACILAVGGALVWRLTPGYAPRSVPSGARVRVPAQVPAQVPVRVRVGAR